MPQTTDVRRAATLTGFAAAVTAASGVRLLDLAPMTTLLVRTRNSVYRIVISSGDAVRVEGGRFFARATEARMAGATVGGSLLKIGWIGVGLRMEIVAGGQRIVTSPVCAIAQEPARTDARVH